MSEILYLIAPIAAAGVYLFIQLRAAHRRKAGRCARCGVPLHPVDEPATWISDSEGQSFRVCQRCAARTRYRWVVLTVTLICLVLAVVIALRFGLLANA